MDEVADRVALLKKGKIEFTGSVDEITPETLQYFYQEGADDDQ